MATFDVAGMSFHAYLIGMMNCTSIFLENHLIIDGILNVRGDPEIKNSLFEIGITQYSGKSFTATIRPGAELNCYISKTLFNEDHKSIKIRTTLIIQGLLRARQTDLWIDKSVFILNGSNAMFDVASAIISIKDPEDLEKPKIEVIEGKICGPLGNIQLSIQSSNAFGFTLSPSCNENDPFPSTLYIKGNFSATVQTRIRNNHCDKIQMSHSDLNFRSIDTAVSVSSAFLDDNFNQSGVVWQVFEGPAHISNQNQSYGALSEFSYSKIAKSSLPLGQFSNTSGVYVYRCATNSSAYACSMCGPGKMMIGTECIECKSGHFSDSGNPHSCKPCAQGYFANSAGSSACIACLPGYVRNAIMNADQCYPCPAGE